MLNLHEPDSTLAYVVFYGKYAGVDVVSRSPSQAYLRTCILHFGKVSATASKIYEKGGFEGIAVEASRYIHASHRYGDS